MKHEELVIKNWTESAPNYSNGILNELESFKRSAWEALIEENADVSEKRCILDVGTGPGFFAIIMALKGHYVTAVDCTQAMVEEAEANALAYHACIDFKVADTQKLPFTDAQFDLIISRNVAWTIIDAEAAYREWMRVLKPGGRVLIFDANWNRRLFNEELRLAYEADLKELAEKYPGFKRHDHSKDMESFRKNMPMCARIRPEWDLEAIKRVGYENVDCVKDFQERIYTPEEQIMYRSTPMFLIKADKPLF